MKDLFGKEFCKYLKFQKGATWVHQIGGTLFQKKQKKTPDSSL